LQQRQEAVDQLLLYEQPFWQQQQLSWQPFSVLLWSWDLLPEKNQ